MTQRSTTWSGVAVIALVITLVTGCVAPEGPQSNTFPLVGKHEPLDCFACHGDLPYGMVPADCSGCHIGVRPNPHYDGECDQCHQPTSWLDLSVDHSFYPLVDSHATVPCASCHVDGYVNTPNTCSGCHEATRPAVHDPGDCGTCHQPTRWSDVNVDHSFFPLVSGHANRACTACHTNGTYQGLSQACESCHLPDRPASHYSGGCGDCHKITSWMDVTIDHSFFPLVGGHRNRACTECHANGTYQGLSSTCENCHRRPNGHPGGACDNCHTIYDFDDD